MGRLLWAPTEDQKKRTNMYQFMQLINTRYHKKFLDYSDLYQWSIENIPDFWDNLWNFVKIKASTPYSLVVDDLDKMLDAKWFIGAKLNFAENLLRYRDDHTALIFKDEKQPSIRMSYAELFDEVARIAYSLRAFGIRPGDRIVGFMPNIPQTIIAMLAATSIGAIWSSCSPDFGIRGILDRFGQTNPRIIFTADGYWFKGKQLDSIERIAGVLKNLSSIEKVVVVPYVCENPDISTIPNAVYYQDFRSSQDKLPIDFEQLPFDHPLYIMYTSGTTGLPKCMVQSAGGILVHQLKEHILHVDLSRDSVIFYFTTCGWMMWNWLTCALGVGATLVLYDGNPFYPGPNALWEMAQNEKITVFGTSAGYLAALQNSGFKPSTVYDLSRLRTLLSTGSPLSIEGFEFVYRDIKSDLQLASISGGSDLNGCFALGNPMGPVYAGELQCRGLAMKVETFDENGNSVIGRPGELVCTAPFPSMPIYFWDDPDGKKYYSAYFSRYPNIWRHGDFIELNEHGGIVIYGRSDATLNPGGVRIGTAEIYRQLEQIKVIEDSLVIGQNWKNDVRVILFIKLLPGFSLTEDLKNQISHTIRINASPRHVPAKIIAVPGIPYTLTMKKVELAVQRIVQGKPVLNKQALSNPEILDYYANLSELRED